MRALRDAIICGGFALLWAAITFVAMANAQNAQTPLDFITGIMLFWSIPLGVVWLSLKDPRWFP